MDPSLGNKAAYSILSNKKMEEFYGESVKDRIDAHEFRQRVLEALKGAEEPLDEAEIQKLFELNDVDEDGHLNTDEMRTAYLRWLRRVVAPVNALIIVDVQNDFITGSLAVNDAEAIVPVINRLVKEFPFDHVAYTLDFHPADHISFFTNVGNFKLDASSPIQDPNAAEKFSEVIFDTRFGPTPQTLWPPHCIQGTHGSELHSDLYVRPDNFMVYKGLVTDVESYTAFGEPDKNDATCLDATLRQNHVTEVFVVGLAADICVGCTGRDALLLDYDVAMVEDAGRAVSADGLASTKELIHRLGGHYCDSGAVLAQRGFTLDHRVASLRRALRKALESGPQSC